MVSLLSLSLSLSLCLRARPSHAQTGAHSERGVSWPAQMLRFHLTAFFHKTTGKSLEGFAKSIRYAKGTAKQSAGRWRRRAQWGPRCFYCHTVSSVTLLQAFITQMLLCVYCIGNFTADFMHFACLAFKGFGEILDINHQLNNACVSSVVVDYFWILHLIKQGIKIIKLQFFFIFKYHWSIFYKKKRFILKKKIQLPAGLPNLRFFRGIWVFLYCCLWSPQVKVYISIYTYIYIYIYI